MPARLLLQTLNVLSKAASAESLEKPENPESCCHPIYSGRQVTPFGYVEDVLHFRANARGGCDPRGQSDNSRLAIYQTLSGECPSCLCVARVRVCYPKPQDHSSVLFMGSLGVSASSFITYPFQYLPFVFVSFIVVAFVWFFFS